MGIFNKNIQEMEASGELHRLRSEVFKFPTDCGSTDGASEDEPFQVDALVPYAFMTGIMIAVALLLALINRAVWKSRDERGPQKMMEGKVHHVQCNYPPELARGPKVEMHNVSLQDVKTF